MFLKSSDEEHQGGSQMSMVAHGPLIILFYVQSLLSFCCITDFPESAIYWLVVDLCPAYIMYSVMSCLSDCIFTHNPCTSIFLCL